MGEDKKIQVKKKGGKSKSKLDHPNVEKFKNLDEHSKKIVAVRRLMRERDTARKEGDFGKSDELRSKLESEMGVEVKDQKDGPSGWRFKNGATKKLRAGTQVPEDAMKLKESKIIDPSKKLKLKKQQKKDEAEAIVSSSSGKEKNSKGGETERNKAMLGMVASNKPGKRVVNGVTLIDKVIGKGTEATSGKRCKMHYTGTLQNGKVFDSSIGKRPFSFKLGRGEVIQGWDIGVKGMRCGGQRKLLIPAPLGYGRQGAPPVIPPNAPLTFEVQLLEVN
jgi:FKBP-type peptidyl-prolyl cis-trans isomerase